MSASKAKALRGTLDLLILKSLEAEPLHGVGIFRRIKKITRGEIQVSYGSLFPALHRMEERGWLSSEWSASDHNRQAKYYGLTKAGQKQLQVEEREWERIVKAVGAALLSQPNE
jgi:transcriptional regulator